MIRQISRNDLRKRIHVRIRRKLLGRPERPRLNVYRSLKHIYAQVIDDHAGRTPSGSSAATRSSRRAYSRVRTSSVHMISASSWSSW